MSAHAPGPWAADRRAVFSASGACIATVYSGACDSLEEADATERLIAAAPELLAALQGILAVASVRIDDPRIAQWDAAHAAIAKAGPASVIHLPADDTEVGEA